jgi:hypothetical protein
MHGNNPTRDWIEAELTRHAADGRIKSWQRHPDFGRYGNAPKWEVRLNPVSVPAGAGLLYGTVPLKTYQEGRLFCAALASAEKMPQAAGIAEQIRRSMGGYTQEQLQESFDLVCSRDNWKDPVRCVLPADLTAEDRRRIEIAITHFTGSVAQWSLDADGCWVVEAAGYYAAIGG